MIPEHTKQGLIEWVQYGNQYQHGSFITALMSNKLMESFAAADEHNQASMFQIVLFIYKYLPVSCYGEGSKEWQGMPDNEFELWKKVRLV
jgi:hypothetical protein